MPRLKVNYQKQRTGKESMKMIIRHFKLNILSVQNESGGHMRWIIIFEQEIIFISSRGENVQNKNF